MTDSLRHLIRAAALVLALTAVAACGSSNGDEAADATTAAPTTAAPSTTIATESGTESNMADAAEFQADATLLTTQFSKLENDTYRVDTLGTPFSFTVDQATWVQPNSDALFVLTHPGSQGPNDRDIVFIRLSEFADPTQPGSRPDGWPADDLDGWLESLTDDIVVSNRADTTLGGRDAVRLDLQLAAGAECGNSDLFCVAIATNRGVNALSLDPSSQHRVWVVDQGSEAPLVVAVAIRSGSYSAWFDDADQILATLAFGEPQPNPVPAEGDLWALGFTSEVPTGVLEVSQLGGIRIELAEASFLRQETTNRGWLSLEEQPADTEFLLMPLDMDGNQLSTADELVAELTANGVDVTETDPTTVGGLPGRVFDLSGGPQQPLLQTGIDVGWWGPPTAGRMWLIEHPDRGLLMITAEAFSNVDSVLQLVLARTEAIVASLEFVELG